MEALQKIITAPGNEVGYILTLKITPQALEEYLAGTRDDLCNYIAKDVSVAPVPVSREEIDLTKKRFANVELNKRTAGVGVEYTDVVVQLDTIKL